MGYECPKRNVFKHFLKPPLDFLDRTPAGILFHIFGPAALKNPSLAKLVLHLADGRLPLGEDLREQLWVAIGRTSIRYCGADPILQQCTR